MPRLRALRCLSTDRQGITDVSCSSLSTIDFRLMNETSGTTTRDYDWWLLAILAAICTLGVIEIYSATHGSHLAGMHMRLSLIHI